MSRAATTWAAIPLLSPAASSSALDAVVMGTTQRREAARSIP